MKIGFSILVAYAAMTIAEAIILPKKLNHEQDDRIHQWIDSLHHAYKRDAIYNRLCLDLDRRLTSSQMQVDSLKRISATVSHTYHPVATKVFLITAQ